MWLRWAMLLVANVHQLLHICISTYDQLCDRIETICLEPNIDTPASTRSVHHWIHGARYAIKKQPFALTTFFRDSIGLGRLLSCFSPLQMPILRYISDFNFICWLTFQQIICWSGELWTRTLYLYHSASYLRQLHTFFHLLALHIFFFFC